MFSGLPGGKPLFSLPSIRQKVRWTFLVILYTKGADSDSFCEGGWYAKAILWKE